MEFHKKVNINIPSFQFSIIPFFPAKSGKNLSILKPFYPDPIIPLKQNF